MSTTLRELWRTEPLTTSAVVVERAAVRGVVAGSLRAETDVWAGLSDEDRRELAGRLSFQRWRANRSRRLRHRVVHAGGWMRLVSEITTAALLLVAIVGAGAWTSWRRLGKAVRLHGS